MSSEQNLTFAKNLNHYIERSGRTKKEIAEIVGVAPSTLNEWTKGKKYPRMGKVEKLAEYFGILKSDLIEEKSEEHREIQKKNDALSDIVIRMQTDDKFFSAVVSLYNLDEKKLSSILALLD